MPVTQTELLNKSFTSDDNVLFNGIFKTGLYVLAGTSKVGKSIMATSIANCVANWTDFLGISMPKGKVLYFDNDNYEPETKARLLAIKLGKTDDIIYEFNDAMMPK